MREQPMLKWTLVWDLRSPLSPYLCVTIRLFTFIEEIKLQLLWDKQPILVLCYWFNFFISVNGGKRRKILPTPVIGCIIMYIFWGHTYMGQFIIYANTFLDAECYTHKILSAHALWHISINAKVPIQFVVEFSDEGCSGVPLSLTD